MTTAARCSAEITVDLPRDEAISLFTPEGERRWAEGWDPQYREAGRCEGPGAVFTTARGETHTTWIMVDQRPEGVHTRVRVTYDLASLTPAGEAWLESFERDYEDMIGSWSAEIAAALRG